MKTTRKPGELTEKDQKDLRRIMDRANESPLGLFLMTTALLKETEDSELKHISELCHKIIGWRHEKQMRESQ